ncbi:MAG TPA: imelysin family protein [Bacteroidia bacterium]|nr:imelysin family protein [Bacteroidia bacterium]
MKKVISSIRLHTFMLTTLVIAACLAWTGCRKDQNAAPLPEDTFDRTALLINYADSLIIPNFLLLEQRLDSLSVRTAAFSAAPGASELYALRAAFLDAYLSYQSVSAFEFGPSEAESFRTNCNTFPTDTAQILLNISNGTYNLFLASNLDAKGFPAIDYLLYGRNISDAAVISYFQNSANRRNYMADLVSHLQTHTTNVLNGWNGNYRSDFISSTGSDIGSSLGYIVNQLNYDLELVKNARIGIPLGKLTMGIPIPEKCECYYAGQSVWLANACFSNIENFYRGRSASGHDAQGLDDYLDHLGAQYQSGSLNSAIQAQFADAKNKLQAVADPLSLQVISNPSLVDTAYVAIKKLVILLKTDMPSNLGIVITYQDTDGD